MASDIKALYEFNKLDKALRDKLFANVYCSACRDVTTIVDYDIVSDRLGIILKGKCKKCGGNIARFVESE